MATTPPQSFSQGNGGLPQPQSQPPATPPSPAESKDSNSRLPPVPASPTYSYASTANGPTMSSYNLPLPPPPPRTAHAVLTQADLLQSQSSYADLLSSAKSYRIALAALGTASSSFGSALESCARLKEARADALGPPALAASLSNSFNAKGSCTADSLLAAAGVHHLIANHEQILSETVYRAFEVPLLHELDKWRRDVEDEEQSYLTAVKKQSLEIRRLEKEGLKLHKQRRRDVGKFRSHLVELTTKLDGLTSLHGDHARTLLRESQDTSVKILDASCSLVRAEVDIFESLARKGWSGGGLEDLLEKGSDLFATEDSSADAHANDSSKLFSILPPKSILADTASDNGTQMGVASEPYQSLAGAISQPRDADSVSVFSEFNRPRMLRPFSPQPMRVDPDDVMGDGDASEVSEASSPETIRHGDTSRGEGFKIRHPDLTLTADDDDDDESHPWRDEVRRDNIPLLKSEQRERSWTATEDNIE